MDKMLTQEEIVELLSSIIIDDEENSDITENPEASKKSKHEPHTDQWGYEAMFIRYRGEPINAIYAPEYSSSYKCETCEKIFDIGDAFAGSRSCPHCGQRYDIDFFIT